MNVLFLTNIPSPYRISFFNELGKMCNLTVLFERKTAKDREDKWFEIRGDSFNALFLKGINIGNDSALCFDVLRWLKDKSYDIIVVGGYSTPTGIITIEYLSYRKIPFLLNSDGGMVKHDSIFKYKIKRHLRSKAKAWLSTSESGDESIIKYGVKKENIYRYPFTSLMKKDILTSLVSKREKKQIRNTLQMKEEKIVITVGQFIFRKGFDILLKACKDIEEEVGVYIIGGEPTPEYLKLIDQYQLKNIHFESFKPKSVLKQYYMASDIFVLPTREDVWGLVINEAMACGLPIITTNKCVAGVELIKNEKNGFIIDIEDVDSLSDKLNLLLSEEELRLEMSKNNLSKIQKYTIENMAKVHLEIFKEIIGGKKEGANEYNLCI